MSRRADGSSVRVQHRPRGPPRSPRPATAAENPRPPTPCRSSRRRSVRSRPAPGSRLATTPDRVQGLTNRTITIVDQLNGYVQSSEIDSAQPEPGDQQPVAADPVGEARRRPRPHLQARQRPVAHAADEDLTDQREALEASVRDARADREGLRNRLEKATTGQGRARLRALLDRATRRVTHPADPRGQSSSVAR